MITINWLRVQYEPCAIHCFFVPYLHVETEPTEFNWPVATERGAADGADVDLRAAFAADEVAAQALENADKIWF